MNHVFTFFGMLDIVTCRVQYIGYKPCVEVIEFKPLTRFQIQREHRYSRIVRREDITGVISRSPLNTFALYSNRAEPCIERDASSRIGEIASIIGLFVFRSGEVMEEGRLGEFGSINLVIISRIIGGIKHARSFPRVIPE